MSDICVVSENGHVLGTHSWVEGFKPLKVSSRTSEIDVLAHALYLERTVSSEAGLEYIEVWEKRKLLR